MPRAAHRRQYGRSASTRHRGAEVGAADADVDHAARTVRHRCRALCPLRTALARNASMRSRSARTSSSSACMAHRWRRSAVCSTCRSFGGIGDVAADTCRAMQRGRPTVLGQLRAATASASRLSTLARLKSRQQPGGAELSNALDSGPRPGREQSLDRAAIVRPRPASGQATSSRLAVADRGTWRPPIVERVPAALSVQGTTGLQLALIPGNTLDTSRRKALNALPRSSLPGLLTHVAGQPLHIGPRVGTSPGCSGKRFLSAFLPRHRSRVFYVVQQLHRPDCCPYCRCARARDWRRDQGYHYSMPDQA